MASTRADTITQTSKQQVIYSDFTDNFISHPITSDLVVIKNQASITQAIKNLIMTNPGERLFNPFYGSGITGTLFENQSPFLSEDITMNVMLAMAMFEPRATLIGITITFPETGNGVTLNVVYAPINIPEPVSISIFLARVR